MLCMLAMTLLVSGCTRKQGAIETTSAAWQEKFFEAVESASVTVLPEAEDHQPFTVLNDNQPNFSEADITTEEYEFYSELDQLGRCGMTMACIGPSLMPTEERGEIGMVKPSGWHTVKYDVVDGKYLYNRCHLIGYQLTGENANVKNLITGTRYMNVQGMLPFENEVADYIKETGNHVLYRVTPVFTGKNLVADGVIMEAWSVEDQGTGVCFHVFVHNRQPGVVINYETGESFLEQPVQEEPASQERTDDGTLYVLNLSSMKVHLPDCKSVSDMKPQNRQEYRGNLQDLLADGYLACGNCKPE